MKAKPSEPPLKLKKTLVEYTSLPMSLQLSIKHGTQNVELQLDGLATIADLQLEVERATGVFVRKQKLIFKGKVVSGLEKKALAELTITSGAKLMLLAADGVATQVGMHAGCIIDDVANANF